MTSFISKMGHWAKNHDFRYIIEACHSQPPEWEAVPPSCLPSQRPRATKRSSRWVDGRHHQAFLRKASRNGEEVRQCSMKTGESIRSSTSVKPWERIHNPAQYRDTIDRGFLPGVSIQQAQFVRHVRNLLPRRILSDLPTFNERERNTRT
jgi:hypothetical protein